MKEDDIEDKIEGADKEGDVDEDEEDELDDNDEEEEFDAFDALDDLVRPGLGFPFIYR